MTDAQEVKKLANLARIEISDADAEKLGKDMTSILGYVDQIKDAEFMDMQEEQTDKVYNVLREDKNPHESGINKETLVTAAPDNDGQHVKVKKIL